MKIEEIRRRAKRKLSADDYRKMSVSEIAQIRMDVKRLLKEFDALHAQQEPNEPLTLEELRKIETVTPVWATGDFQAHWELAEWIPTKGGSRKLHWISLCGGEDYIPEKIVNEIYGTETMKYYRSKPGQEEYHDNP